MNIRKGTTRDGEGGKTFVDELYKKVSAGFLTFEHCVLDILGPRHYVYDERESYAFLKVCAAFATSWYGGHYTE